MIICLLIVGPFILEMRTPPLSGRQTSTQLYMYNVMQLCAVKCTKLEDSSFYLDIKTNVTEFHSREVPIYMYISVRDHEWQ